MPNNIYDGNHQSFHSHEMQDIVGPPRNGFLKWGMYIILFIFSILFCLSWIIKYPESIKGNLTIKAINSPKSVNAKIDGKLVKLFVSNDINVKSADIIGFIESTSDHLEILQLSNDIDTLIYSIQKNDWKAIYDFKNQVYYKLGSLENSFQTFSNSLFELKSFIKDGFYSKNKDLIKNDIENLEKINSSLKIQDKVYKNDLEISEKQFNIKNQLKNEGIIPRYEMQQEEKILLNKKIPIESIIQEMIRNESIISQKHQESLLLEKKLNEYKSSLIRTAYLLKSEIDNWKLNYLLLAPIDGRVSYSSYIQEFQDLKAGQEVLFITPNNSKYYCEMNVGQKNFGKVQIGQNVIIRLSSFPYQEYGSLIGKVSFISDIPNIDNTILVIVDLPNGFKSESNVIIPFRNEMVADAEIITEKMRIAYKLMHSFRSLINKKNFL